MTYDNTLGSNSYAVLVFASNKKDLLKVSREVLKNISGTKARDVSVRLMKKNHVSLLQNGDPEKLARMEAHCVVDMDCCPACELWGEEWPNEGGICGYCGHDPLLG